MTVITSAKADIQQEEVAFNAGLSSATFTKLGAAINFINNKHYEKHSWILNGTYSNVASNGIDGIFICPFNMEITAIGMSNITTGISGTTEADIKWLSGTGTVVGSIFSVTPKIASTASNNAYLFKNLITAVTVTGTGLTIPTFSKTTFLEGQALRFDILQAQVRAENLGLYIFFRPT